MNGIKRPITEENFFFAKVIFVRVLKVIDVLFSIQTVYFLLLHRVAGKKIRSDSDVQ